MSRRPYPPDLTDAQWELVRSAIVERTFAWLMRYRRLRADYETESASSRGWILIAAVHRMPRRLAQ